MSKTVAVIAARGGSKRVPRKNLREFLGLPLVSFSIRAAQACPQISQIIVSTDEPEIAAIGEAEGAEAWMRPPELATDTASTFHVLQHVYQKLAGVDGKGPDYIVLLQPTSPLRRLRMIDEGLQKIQAETRATSLISVFAERAFTGEVVEGFWVPDFPENTRSQDIPPKYIPTGSLYIYKCSETIIKNNALGAHTLPLFEEKDRVVNIDHEHDFWMLKEVYEQHGSDYEYLLRRKPLR